MSDLDTSNMFVISGCFCCAAALYTDFPACVGCSGMNECLCVQEEFCLKAGTTPMPCVVGPAEGFICKIGLPCCSCGLKIPTVLCKGKSQMCCVAAQQEFPPGTDVPMLCALYGLVLYPKVGCCMKWSEFK
mmetsp:Transcript_58828/g.120362  ORF Transcript_58828/g.120362 Transcript_58828/m.120362 type:complete len:131 (-) Transcript_58828:165-557(-)